MSIKIHVPLTDRGILAVSGADARSFLQGLITNDMDLVSPKQAIYAALLTPQGKFLHDFFIVEHQERFLLDCAAARIPDLLKRLKMYRLRAKVEIADESGAWGVGVMLEPHGTGGGNAPTRTPGTAKTRFDGVSYIDPRHEGMGERTIRKVDEGDGDGPDAAILEKNRAIYEEMRIALGIPDSGLDLVADKSMPLECGFDELHGVSFTKGCFVGQEVTTRMKHRNLVKKRLFPVMLAGDVESGATVRHGDIEAGEVRSVRGDRGIALLRLDLAEKGGLTADAVAVTPEKPDWANF